jgi:hypothetical protein
MAATTSSDSADVDTLLEQTSELTPEEQLAAAVVRLGLKHDGPRYLTWPCGRWWIQTMGFEVEDIWSIATKGTRWAHKPYESKDKCAHKKSRDVASLQREAVALYRTGVPIAEIAKRQKSTLRAVFKRLEREKRNGQANDQH